MNQEYRSEQPTNIHGEKATKEQSPIDEIKYQLGDVTANLRNIASSDGPLARHAAGLIAEIEHFRRVAAKSQVEVSKSSTDERIAEIAHAAEAQAKNEYTEAEKQEAEEIRKTVNDIKEELNNWKMNSPVFSIPNDDGILDQLPEPDRQQLKSELEDHAKKATEKTEKYLTDLDQAIQMLEEKKPISEVNDALKKFKDEFDEDSGSEFEKGNQRREEERRQKAEEKNTGKVEQGTDVPTEALATNEYTEAEKQEAEKIRTYINDAKEKLNNWKMNSPVFSLPNEDGILDQMPDSDKQRIKAGLDDHAKKATEKTEKFLMELDQATQMLEEKKPISEVKDALKKSEDEFDLDNIGSAWEKENQRRGEERRQRHVEDNNDGKVGQEADNKQAVSTDVGSDSSQTEQQDESPTPEANVEWTEEEKKEIERIGKNAVYMNKNLVAYEAASNGDFSNFQDPEKAKAVLITFQESSDQQRKGLEETSLKIQELIGQHKSIDEIKESYEKLIRLSNEVFKVNLA